MKLSATSLIYDLFLILQERDLHVRPVFRNLCLLVSYFLFHFWLLLLHVFLEVSICLLHRDDLFLHSCVFFGLFVVVHGLSGLDHVVFGDAQASDLSFECGLVACFSM